MKAKTIREVLDALPGKLDKDAAEDVDAVYQFDLQGTQGGQYQLLGELSLTSSTIARHPLVPGEAVRYIVICREGYAVDRDDVVVDAVQGACR